MMHHITVIIIIIIIIITVQCTPSETVFEDVEAPGGGDSVFGAGGPSSRRFSIPRAPDFSN